MKENKEENIEKNIGKKAENSEAAVENPKVIKESEKTDKKGSKKKRRFPIAALSVFSFLVICLGIYGGIAFSYKDKFLPNTWINDIDCSELDAAQVAGLLDNQLQNYHAEIIGRDPNGTSGAVIGQFTAQEIHLTYSADADSRDAVDTLLEEQNKLTWLYRKLSDNTYSTDLYMGVSYDAEALKSIVSGWEACQSVNMTAPQNAYIDEYSEHTKSYEIVPETEGTKFNVQQLLELIDVMIISQETSLDIESEGCYAEPTVRQDDPQLTESVETANKWLETKVTYDWNGPEVVVDAALLKDWITMKRTGPVLDEKAVAAFVKEQADEYDTYRKRKSFLTTLGVELSLSNGNYGWLTDEEEETKELVELIYQGSNVSREPVYANTARQKGVNDIGDSYVEADLTHQHLYLYENGAVIFETDFVSGSMSSTPDCVTPEGIYGLTYKTTNAVLRGRDYETPVNYWMPFFGNYGMHDATWRGEFGGQIYIGNGSHGCINLPLGSAALIYEHVSTGFPVICYYYQVDPLADQYVDTGWEDDNEDDE